MEWVSKRSWWVLWMGVFVLFMVPFASQTRAADMGFYVELVDGPDSDNVVSFSDIFVNRDNRTYRVGIASPDHTWYSSGEEVSPNSVEEDDDDFAPGLYDVYLTWLGEDGPNIIWTSQPGTADFAINDSDPSPTLAIAWQNGINFSLFVFTFDDGDGFRVQPVPLPAGAWLLGVGLVGVALGRKFKATK